MRQLIGVVSPAADTRTHAGINVGTGLEVRLCRKRPGSTCGVPGTERIRETRDTPASMLITLSKIFSTL